MLKWWRFLIFKIFFLFSFFSLLTGCGQDFNSNYGDFGQYAPIEGIDSSTPEGARLLAAYKVLQAKCFQCHSWSNYKTSQAWIDAGRVVAGNPSASSIYSTLKNNNGNMPPDPFAPLTSAEIVLFEDWINNL